MKNTRLFKLLSSFLCVMLLAAAVFCVSGLGETAVEETVEESVEIASEESSVEVEFTELGEGDTAFVFTVTYDVDDPENSDYYIINTNAATVGEALVELGLVEGEDSEYGLYVKTINGVTADYDTDGTYWAFFIDGEYAMTGVDSTEIDPESVYSFIITK